MINISIQDLLLYSNTQGVPTVDLEPMKDAYAKIVKDYPAQAVIVDVIILLSALVIA